MITENQQKVLSCLRSDGIDATDARRAAWSLIECVGNTVCIKEYATYLVSNMYLSACDDLIDELIAIAEHSGQDARINYYRCIESLIQIRSTKTERTNKW